MSISFKEARRRLPEPFLKRLEDRYSLSDYESVLRGFMVSRSPVFRLNSLKIAVENLEGRLRDEKVRFRRIPGFDGSYEIVNGKESQVERLPIWEEGKIYFQGLASQIPPLILAPQPGNRVLDMTAAPGSKTTQMAAMMDNSGEILANELDPIRFEKLQFNVRKQGVTNVSLRQGDGGVLYKEHEQSFDAILLDVPCSGEGRFRLEDSATFRYWSDRLIRDCAKTQRRLLKSAARCLKPGGKMVYSTCTLSYEENEGMLAWFLQEFPEFVLIPVPDLGIQPLKKKEEEFSEPIRIMPNHLHEGFYVALLVKAG